MQHEITAYNELRKTQGYKAAQLFASTYITSLNLPTPAERGRVWDQFKAEEREESQGNKKKEATAKRKTQREARKNKASIKSVCASILNNRTTLGFIQLSPSESQFLTDISTKRKLTEKQAKWLRDLAVKTNVAINGEITIRESKSTQVSCGHEDLGSLGYRHGDTVKCPHCGAMAEVW